MTAAPIVGDLSLPRGPVVKICGLTRAEDALAAMALGAWALGFVFADSPRRLTPAAARALADRVASGRRKRGARSTPDPLFVGVFADTPVEEIVRIVGKVGLDGVQLHGLAGPGASEVREALGGVGRSVLLIQAVPVDRSGSAGEESGSLSVAAAVAGKEADLVLLDSASTQRFGGTGEPFPWHLARAVTKEWPVLVAGGVGPENVRAALEESGAWGVDVSSRVESAPGIKDAGLMERLFARVEEGRGS